MKIVERGLGPGAGGGAGGGGVHRASAISAWHTAWPRLIIIIGDNDSSCDQTDKAQSD
ncbi:MAG: hypothetical protein GWP70_09665 [Proteobacteria bacterium]|nr:hypothetical protein [Pseudomonadota bacterium]